MFNGHTHAHAPAHIWSEKDLHKHAIHLLRCIAIMWYDAHWDCCACTLSRGNKKFKKQLFIVFCASDKDDNNDFWVILLIC